MGGTGLAGTGGGPDYGPLVSDVIPGEEVLSASASDVESSSVDYNYEDTSLQYDYSEITASTEGRGGPLIEHLRSADRVLNREGARRVQSLVERYGEDVFVLGPLLFQVPPVAIRVKKGNLSWQWKPLRANNTIAVKSGQGECFIEVDLVFVGLNQINTYLSPLISLWKKSPFCFIENKLVRGMMLPDAPGESMAVCLETLVMDTMAGKPDVVFATLLLRWFNYKPFSKNFLYRRTWEGPTPVARNREEARREMIEAKVEHRMEEWDPEGVEEEENEGRIQEEIRTRAAVTREIDQQLVDVPSIVEAPSESVIGGLPAEDLSQITHLGDPSDQLLLASEPVVYPWNSRPYMSFIRSNPPPALSQWKDGISFSWKSMARRLIPRSWAFVDISQGTREVASFTRSYSSTGPEGAATGTNPQADIVLVIGDSISNGYLGVNYTGDIELREYTGSRFQSAGGKAIYTLVSQGKSTLQMLTALRNLATNNRAIWDRVVGAIIMGGINDAGGTGTAESIMRNLNSMAQLITGKGGIAALVTPTPVKNSTLSSAGQTTLIGPNGVCVQVLAAGGGRTNDRLVSINSHWDGGPGGGNLVLATTAGTFESEMNAEYRQTSPSPPDINVHPNSAGSIRLAQHISARYPWNALRPSAANPIWTVCGVGDGDSLQVYRDGKKREIRLFHIDAYETYSTDINHGGTLHTCPNGQDTGKPAGNQWGRLAKEALERLAPIGSEVSLDFRGPDAYGRWLAVVTNGNGVEVNLDLVRQGLVFSRPSPEDSDTPRPTTRSITGLANYTQAEAEAEEQGLGFWGDETRMVDPPAGWQSLPPWQFRSRSVNKEPEAGFDSRCQGDEERAR